MKTILFIGFCILFSTLLQAQPDFAGKENALKAANKFLEKQIKNNLFSVISNSEISVGNTVLCYVFDLSPNGFIIVSSDTKLPPVIAYSWESRFGEMNLSNPLYSLVIKNLKRKPVTDISFSLKNNILWNELLNNTKSIDSAFEQWPSTGNGWLATNFTQNAPYNNFCPMDPVTSQRSIAGCPSVAMAMILDFHRTTNNTQFDFTDDYYHNYAGRQYWIDNDYLSTGFPSFPQLNSYLDTLSDHYINNVSITNNDKAALVFACGVAARQVYTSGGSGTFGVNQAWDAYQRFNFTTAALLDTNDTDLFTRLIQNIKDTLPAHLAIVNQSSTSGHNVVVDGYNTDNYFHLNFGWGGSYNGWYLIPQEIPYSLTYIEGVVLDIIKSPTTYIRNTNEEINDFNIFPNPANKSNFSINYVSDDFENFSIRISDINGSKVYTGEFSKNTESINLTINSEIFVNGYYLIEISTGSKIIRKPLIIQ